MRHFVFFCLVVLWIVLPTAFVQGAAPSFSKAVILADLSDPYYALAEEIARHEALPIVHSLDEVLARGPVFLLWVVSPSRLSDQVLVEFGLAMRDREQAVSTGIISGSTLERAKELWQRASQVQGQRAFAINNENPTAGIFEGQIIAFNEDGSSVESLTKAALQRVLQKADYLTYTGHGGEKWWQLDEDSDFRASDIPHLPPVVIGTASCNTFRIWRQGSIALSFADKGAAAYAGFAYSPNEGYLVGEFDDLPFQYTWPDFPIGHVVRVQNRGTLQGFARFPYYHLLGDPRIALQMEPPYRLANDLQEGNTRTLTFTDAPAGAIPVRIPGGARYGFVIMRGVTAAWEHDPFYNSRLQMENIGDDKYLLLVHQGGDFELRLRPRPPWHWVLADLLVDSLDHVLLFLQVGGGDIIALAFAGIASVVAGCALRRRKGVMRALMLAALVGLSFAGLHGLYALARLDHVTVTSKTLEFRPLSVVGTFLLTGCGAFLFLNAKSRLAKGIALSVATFLTWAAAVLSLGVIAFSGWFIKARVGTTLWNYALGLMPLGALALECVLFGLVFSALQRWFSRQESQVNVQDKDISEVS
ncbi:MAG: hypothetical protein JSV36_01090 [Anaerolineae bacterium]|nr:MAG: hypothetical protein JSV36_01090 [Anaerolineae bacterium]